MLPGVCKFEYYNLMGAKILVVQRSGVLEEP